MTGYSSTNAFSRLHLGCGTDKVPGAVGVDINPRSAADVVCDLDHRPLPFADDSFDEVICLHVLEHLDDLVGVMEEIHRVSRAGGRVLVEVPHFSSVFFYQDPTHRHAFTSRTFDYFIAGTTVSRFGYSRARFILENVCFPPPEGAGLLKRLAFDVVNRNLDGYEKRLAFILPRHLLRFELRVLKRGASSYFASTDGVQVRQSGPDRPRRKPEAVSE